MRHPGDTHDPGSVSPDRTRLGELMDRAAAQMATVDALHADAGALTHQTPGEGRTLVRVHAS
ncbi:hypothetical protein GCM10020367_59240 [Streptomyces sannanensis]|uniref:Uncharacterized protein n=1 Tax=Streptomyces sannanensis TaxID=285536 RepID=A0ABP6SK98_9ACTN